MSNQNIGLEYNECLNLSPLREIKYVKVLTTTQDQVCYALAIHSNKSFFIYQHKNYLKRKTLFSSLRNFKLINKFKFMNYADISHIQFLKKTNQFISTHLSKYISIWSCESSQNFWVGYKLNEEHNNWIITLAVNREENEMISGGQDCMIKFWCKDKNWECYQSIQAHDNQVLSLSLSESDKKLISTGKDWMIVIMEKVKNQYWSVVQKMDVRFGYRLSFISENLFTHQLAQEKILETYKFDEKSQSFKKFLEAAFNFHPTDNIGYDYYYFAQKFIKSKGILVSKLDYCVNILSYRNNNFQTIQVIPYRTEFIFGTVNDDGEILITTDEGSRNIKIFKLTTS